VPRPTVSPQRDSVTALPLAERPHALYRFYDAAGTLLYVGITAALPTRLGDHDEKKPWWTTVSKITVEHYDNREKVLAAEIAAITAERPLHNIQHNRRRGGSTGPAAAIFDRAFGDVPAWTFVNLRSGHARTVPLYLYWEVPCDPISNDWAVGDISADELWRIWLTRYPRDERAEVRYGTGAFRISWFVDGPGTFEAAPFQDDLSNPPPYNDHFMTHFTWPQHPVTRERLQWSSLPVIDKVWRLDRLPDVRDFKGGFVQEATGWKPSPLQPFVNVHQLARAALLYTPEAAR
jgi:hypothetical protein